MTEKKKRPISIKSDTPKIIVLGIKEWLLAHNTYLNAVTKLMRRNLSAKEFHALKVFFDIEEQLCFSGSARLVKKAKKLLQKASGKED